MSSVVVTILLVVLVILVVVVISRSVRIVPQARAGIVERFGRYHRTLHAGLNIVTPFVDRLLPLIDLREQVVSFPPQPVITGGQPRRRHRHGYLFPGDRRPGRHLRGRQLHHRRRAADRDHVA